MTEKVWDAHPIKRVYRGQVLTFFTRGALAKALNRQVVTIRAMEHKGILCHPQVKEGGQGKGGRWLYTAKQIEDLVKLAEQEDVIDPLKRNKFSDRFVEEAHKILRRKPQI